ncbi:hypothetical protein HPC49_17065 [Pyxidicoccus fallax]|uniref:STAS/SEC14 domain-containing protein n=1 Tax=Pyxidicoccus fallax TaxID=394095 RepID=A0A848LPB4_9BACT|nr:hypothetical protein [Pyxidicoccus fallax]NMO19509.1 hypothetical protein [Pyxidicoccus fallax]NPC79927.1 hypothetical protein [Pyxidicoccus fallax]
MAGQPLYTSDHIDIRHEADEGWLYVDWKGYQSVEMVKAGCEEMLRQLTRLGLAKVLNDNTHVTGIWVGAAAWLASSWFPRMRNAGMRHFAWIQSPARLSYVSATTTVQQMDPEMAVLFDDAEAARAWLRAQP